MMIPPHVGRVASGREGSDKLKNVLHFYRQKNISVKKQFDCVN